MARKKTVYFKRSKYRAEEFSVNDLPRSRAKQYFDILKNDWKLFLLLGFFFVLFSIPYLTVGVLHWFIKVNLPAQLEADGGTPEMIYSALQLTEILYEVALVPCSLLICIPLAGTARILKRLAHAEGVLFKDDFVSGLKMNIWHFIVFMFIYCFLRFIAQFTYIYIENIPIVAPIVRGVSMGILYVLFVPILLVMFAQDSLYKISIWMNFKNSYQIAVRQILVMLIFSLIIFGIYFLRLINHPIIETGILLVVIFLSPFYLLALFLFALSKFDKYINADYYPDIYRKGLRPDILGGK